MTSDLSHRPHIVLGLLDPHPQLVHMYIPRRNLLVLLTSSYLLDNESSSERWYRVASR